MRRTIGRGCDPRDSQQFHVAANCHRFYFPFRREAEQFECRMVPLAAESERASRDRKGGSDHEAHRLEHLVPQSYITHHVGLAGGQDFRGCRPPESEPPKCFLVHG